MGRTRLAKTSISKLRERIHTCKERKKELLHYLHKLEHNYKSGKISYAKYIEILHKHTDGRTIEELVIHYEHEIHHCRKEIRKHKKTLHKNRFLITFFSLILISALIFAILYSKPIFTGFAIQEQGFTQSINFETTQSTTYQWEIENQGILICAKITGSLEGKGNAKVYLDNILMLDTSKIKSAKITGGAIEETENKRSIWDFFKRIFARITGKVAEESEELSLDEPEQTSAPEPETTTEESPASEPTSETTKDTTPTDESYSEEINQEEASQIQEDSSPSQSQDENLELPSNELGTEEPLPSETIGETTEPEEQPEEPIEDTTQVSGDESKEKESIGENDWFD